MNIAPVLMFLKNKPVMWTLAGLSIAFVGFPMISVALPYFFPESRAKVGSYQDVVEMKKVGLLSVQRLQFSKVVTGTFPESETDLKKCEVYVRRIMRGHVTSTVDFNRIDEINSPNGEVVFLMPPLVSHPFIDEWIFYDSYGTKAKNPRNITSQMDNSFRLSMLDLASQPERVKRAKEQAETIVKMLCPDRESYVFRWQDDAKEDVPGERKEESYD